MNRSTSRAGLSAQASGCSPILGIVLALFATGSFLELGAAPPPLRRPGQLLVGHQPHAPLAALQAGITQFHGKTVREFPALRIRLIEVADDRLTEALESLQQLPGVAFVEPNLLIEPALTPDDPYFTYQWYLPIIGAPAAWDACQGSDSVVIAVLDSGVDGAHPELAGKLVPGWNFIDDSDNTSDQDSHGTSVAGIAAATAGNATGIAGIGWNTRVMPLRITDANGYGILSAIAEALVFAADQGVRVANISYAVTASSTVRTAAEYFCSKGGVITVAAGNNARFESYSDNPFVLTVSATTATDALASWSNTGNSIDLAAPGESVLTLVPGNGYGYATGTSFSAPIVAGVAALALAANPALTSPALQNLLKQSCDDLGAAGWDTSFGWGRMNAASAIAAALAYVPDTVPPIIRFTSPDEASTVSGVVDLTTTASDDNQIVRVEFYLDGQLTGSTSSQPAQFAWDSSTVPNGSHAWIARAFDAAGNVGTSPTLEVTVQNAVPDTTPPTVVITSPAGGTKVARKQKIVATASDNVAVTRIDLLIDGQFHATAPSSPATFTWSTTTTARGSHSLQALAYDAAGNPGYSAVVWVAK